MRLAIGCFDRHRLQNGRLSGDPFLHPGEDAFVAPPLPTAVEGLWRAILLRSIAPAQAIAIDKDYGAQHPSDIGARLAMDYREEGLKPRNLRVCQPEKVAHRPSACGG